MVENAQIQQDGAEVSGTRHFCTLPRKHQPERIASRMTSSRYNASTWRSWDDNHEKGRSIVRQLGVFVALLLALLPPIASSFSAEDPVAAQVPPVARNDKIRMEADYILSCQYVGANATYYGALNNVHGEPTWVVPRENGVAIMGLLVAFQALGDEQYKVAAQRAADYLVKMQQSDGCWCDQYVRGTVANPNKSPTQTAETMMAFFKLGYRADTADAHDRYDAMKRGAECLMAFQDVANKGGQDDGLLGGGKDADGSYRRWRWTHDNAYAYWALRMAAFWASRGGEHEFAALCNHRAQDIADGLMAHLYNHSTGVWHIAIDDNGAPQWISGLEGRPNWVQYAPVMLDLPLGVDRQRVGEWVGATFQQEDGSCIGWTTGDEGPVTRKYPGYGFQASLVWLDTAPVAPAQGARARAAIDWTEGSGLWQTEPDDNGVTGGWIDWVEVTPDAESAEEWERFIDTSAYAIMAWNGGYDFGMPGVSLPLTLRPTNR